MPSVGTAYVNIRVNTRGFESGLDALMKRLSTKMEAAGTKLGKDFERGLKKSDPFKNLVDSSNKATTAIVANNKKIGDSADAMGVNISDAADVGASGLAGLRDEISDVSSSMGGLSRDASRVDSALGGMGGGAGRGGSALQSAGDGASFLSRQLSQTVGLIPTATSWLNNLYNAAAFTGTAMAGAVGGISAAAQGIFAIGANAASAAPALAIMANGMIGLAQIGSVMGLAMQGVGGALTAGFDSAEKAATGATSAVGGMGAATAAASRAIRDAKDGLQDAYRDAARAAEDAARRTADAERAMAQAVMDTAQAQRELNAARKEALEQLEDIAFAAEDAGIAEERAALALQDAHAELLAVSGLPPDDRARIEAELAFREAELNMRQAKDARQDADKDQRQAAKNGVEGTDAMKDARGNLADAEEREADAARDLNDARREEARTAQDNAEKIADAQQAVADAQKSLADAQKQGTTAMKAATTAADKYNTLLGELGPNQRAFVEEIMRLKPQFDKVKQAVGEELFGHLNTALENMVEGGWLGRIEKGLTGTATALGKTAVEASKVMNQGPFKRSFSRVMESNNTATEDFGEAGVYLADAFIQIADAAGPVLEDLAEWAKGIGHWASETTRAKNANGKLDTSISNAAETVKEWWRLLKEVWRTTKLVGGAANTAMKEFNDGKGFIPTATENLKAWNDQADKHDLTRRFGQALENFTAAAEAVKTVLKPIIDMGSDERLQTAFETITEHSDSFDTFGDTALDAAPALADLAVSILDIVAAISEGGGIQTFMETLAAVTKPIAGFLTDIVDTKIGKFLLTWAAAAFALRRAFRLIGGTIRFLAAATIPGLITKLDNVFKPRTLKASATGTAAAGAGTVAGAGDEAKEGTWQAEVLVHLKLIVTAIETCCATMRAAMGMAGAGGAMPLGAAPRGGAAVAMPMPTMAPAATAKIGKFAGLMGKLGPVMSKLGPVTKVLSGGLRVLGAAFRFALGPVGMIVLTLLPLLWPLLVKLEEKTGIFSKTLDVLTDAFGWLWDKLKLVFGWIIGHWDLLLAILLGPFGLAVRYIIQHWEDILAYIKKLPGKIKNFLKNMWRVVTDKLGDAYAWVRNKVGQILTWLGKLPGRVFRTLRNLWDVITDKLGDAYTWVRSKVAAMITWIGGIPRRFWDNMKTMWDVVKDKLGDAWDWVVTKWTNIKAAIKRWPGQIKEGLSGLWDGMGQGLISATNWIGEKLNGLIGNLNSILGKFGVDKISFKFPTNRVWVGFAGGGPVMGPGTGTSDSIPARLSRGEHVLTAREVKAMGGHGNVMALRKQMLNGQMPGTGGIIGWVKDKYDTVKSAIKDGAAAAFKWVLSKFKDIVEPADNIVKQVALGALEWASNKIVGFGEKEDREAAAAAAASGAPYTGPPGGWTYPLARKFGITQYPNAGHSPSWSVDIGAPGGTAVRAASRGLAHTASLGNTSYGNYVVVSHAGGQQTLYAHLRSFAIKSGQQVKTGQLLGYSDSTGNSTGDHLHFELKPSSSTIAAMAAHGVKLGLGGVVAPSASGTLAVLAEAGKHERVTPLDSEGFTPAERRILESLEAQFEGGGDTYHVHPSEKMNEQQLADMVARRVAWKRRRGRGSR